MYMDIHNIYPSGTYNESNVNELVEFWTSRILKYFYISFLSYIPKNCKYTGFTSDLM